MFKHILILFVAMMVSPVIAQPQFIPDKVVHKKTKASRKPASINVPKLISYKHLMSLSPKKRQAYLMAIGEALAKYETHTNQTLLGKRYSAIDEIHEEFVSDNVPAVHMRFWGLMAMLFPEARADDGFCKNSKYPISLGATCARGCDSSGWDPREEQYEIRGQNYCYPKQANKDDSWYQKLNPNPSKDYSAYKEALKQAAADEKWKAIQKQSADAEEQRVAQEKAADEADKKWKAIQKKSADDEEKRVADQNAADKGEQQQQQAPQQKQAAQQQQDQPQQDDFSGALRKKQAADNQKSTDDAARDANTTTPESEKMADAANPPPAAPAAVQAQAAPASASDTAPAPLAPMHDGGVAQKGDPLKPASQTPAPAAPAAPAAKAALTKPTETDQQVAESVKQCKLDIPNGRATYLSRAGAEDHCLVGGNETKYKDKAHPELGCESVGCKGEPGNVTECLFLYCAKDGGPLCVTKSQTTAKTCKAQAHKCNKEPSRQDYEKLQQTYADICKKDNGSQDLFCYECHQLRHDIEVAYIALGPEPASTTPPTTPPATGTHTTQ